MLALTLLGCWLGNKGGDGPYCEDTPTVVALDEETALGFPAQALLDAAAGEHLAEMTWSRGGSTGLTVIVTHGGGEARMVESEAVYPEGTTIDIGVECPDRVEVDVAVDFVTDDGWFDESWSLPLVRYAEETVSFAQELDLDALGGTYDIQPDLDADGIGSDYESVSASVRGSFEDGATSGSVGGMVSGEDECEDGENCVAWASSLPIGNWGESE